LIGLCYKDLASKIYCYSTVGLVPIAFGCFLVLKLYITLYNQAMVFPMLGFHIYLEETSQLIPIGVGLGAINKIILFNVGPSFKDGKNPPCLIGKQCYV